MSMSLGPFALERRLAKGGMGEVWTASHLQTLAPAAVKFLTGNRAGQQFTNEFRREVQATARLDHPNIVRIFDYGTVPSDAPEFGLQAGAPFYVMEFGEHGSVEDVVETLTWPQTRDLLCSLLEALAHAHARGVIHRDIKPANILLRNPEATEVLLTDFGIAHASDRATRTDGTDITSRSTEEATGTPKYMAPEQFMGKWRDYGPWTDLYAVGVLTYELVTGKTPFSEATFVMYAMAHMTKPFPALTPRFDVPEQLEAWIGRMTAKNPADRFQHAADAAWALQNLHGTITAAPGAPFQRPQDPEEHDTLVDAPVLAPTPNTSGPDTTPKKPTGPTDRPPIPKDWRRPDEPFRPMPGAGLGLLGIRPTPFSGREPERDQLWANLHNAQSDLRVVILRGPSGAGKSALAQWLTYDAAERGAVIPMQTPHDRVPGARHGLGWLNASHFKTAGLPADEMHARMRTLLGDAPQAEVLARAATELMRQQQAPGEQNETPPLLQIASPAARHGFALKILANEAHKRPLLVWLDDAHFELDSLAFVEFALTEPLGTLPLMFVLTITDEDITPPIEHALARIKSHAQTFELAVPPLEPDTVHTILERMGLEPELAAQVSRHAQNNTLFAIQLMQDWVKRGLLRLEGANLVLEAPRLTPDQLPADIQAVWRAQLNAIVLATLAEGADSHVEIWSAFELAAAFGREVDLDEWHAAALSLNVAAHIGIFEALAQRGLGTLRDRQFTFVNERLRDILVQSANDANRWVRANRAIARALISRYGQDHPGLALRVARHFTEAHDYTVATMCLDEAYSRAFRTGNQDKLAEIFDLQETCLKGLNRSPLDPAFGALNLKRSKLLVWRSEPELRDQGIELLHRAEDAARMANDRRLLAKVLNARGWTANFTHDFEAGIASLQEAIAVAPDDVEKAIAHRILGQLFFDGKNDIARSREHYEQSAILTRDPLDTFSAHQGLFFCAHADGNLALAERHLQAARSIAEEHGLMLGLAFVQENLSSLAEIDQNWPTAAHHLREALNLHELLAPKTVQADQTRIRLARVSLLIDDFETARNMVVALPIAKRPELADVIVALKTRDQQWVSPELAQQRARLNPEDPLVKALAQRLDTH